MGLLAEQVHLVAETGKRLRQLGVVDVRAGTAQEVAVEDENSQGLRTLRNANDTDSTAILGRREPP
jgi:hypothetical protein